MVTEKAQSPLKLKANVDDRDLASGEYSSAFKVQASGPMPGNRQTERPFVNVSPRSLLPTKVMSFVVVVVVVTYRWRKRICRP